MKLNKRSLKITVGMLACLAVLAVGARMSDSVIPASVAADQRPIIVLDAGTAVLIRARWERAVCSKRT